MLYTTVTQYNFIDTMRAVCPENFSYKGLVTLYEYLEELAETIDTELDPIAICCEYSEISIDQIQNETGYDDLSELQDNALVLFVDDTTIIYSV